MIRYLISILINMWFIFNILILIITPKSNNLYAQDSNKIKIVEKKGNKVSIDAGKNKGIKKSKWYAEEFYRVFNMNDEEVGVIYIEEVYDNYSTAKIYGDGSKIKVGHVVRKSTK